MINVHFISCSRHPEVRNCRRTYARLITYSSRVELRNWCRILFTFFQFFFQLFFTRAYFKSERLKWLFSNIWQGINFKKNIVLSDHSGWGWSAEQKVNKIRHQFLSSTRDEYVMSRALNNPVNFRWTKLDKSKFASDKIILNLS